MSTPTIKPSGNIAILWGTDNAMNTPSGALIDTLQLTPKNGAPIEIEGNQGFTAIQVGLRDGFDARATCVYDANKAYPKEGDTVILVGPKQDGNSGTTNYNCTFWAWQFGRAKKGQATIELMFTHRPDING
jgi:hypothetical protein